MDFRGQVRKGNLVGTVGNPTRYPYGAYDGTCRKWSFDKLSGTAIIILLITVSSKDACGGFFIFRKLFGNKRWFCSYAGYVTN